MKITDLHDYQLHTVNHIMENTHCGVFLDMGLGKTVSTLTAIHKLLYEELDIKNCLVVAPKRVAENVWPDEISKWDHLNHLTYSKIVGNPTERREAIRKKADIYIISRDNIAWLCGEFGGSFLPYDMLVIDELSSFKNPRSVRFKSLRKTQPSFKRVVGLTGTPAPNGLIDLWSQIWLMDRGERLGKTLTEYRARYFTPGARNGHIIYNYKLRKQSEENIHEQIKDICISMKSRDYLDLIPPEHNNILINLPEKILKQYYDFEEELVTEIMEGGGLITAVNAAALSTKLLQFSNGAIYDEHRNVFEIHNEKIKALEEILESANGSPVLVAWSFQHDRDRIKKALKKYNPRELKTTKDIQDWNKGEVELMLTHPASGGHGLNLQSGGNILVWFGQNWSLELYQQLNKRLDRQGQENQVTIHHIITNGTIDLDVVKALQNKTNKQDALMESVKARIRKYARTG